MTIGDFGEGGQRRFDTQIGPRLNNYYSTYFEENYIYEFGGYVYDRSWPVHDEWITAFCRPHTLEDDENLPADRQVWFIAWLFAQNRANNVRTPGVSIGGTVGARIGEEVKHQVSVENMSKLATATLWFEVEDAFLTNTSATGLNGFEMIGGVNWTKDGDKYLGRATVGNFKGGVDVKDPLDIFEMTCLVKEAIGTTEIKLTKVELSGYDENNEAVFMEAPIKNGIVSMIVDYNWDIADVNRDKVVNQLDLTAAQLAYQTSAGEANWNANADANADGKVDVEDFILILGRINWDTEIAA
jgi:hypothetical protein